MKTRDKIYFIFFFFFNIVSGNINATHIVGGEIYYTKLSGNNYEIFLKVYRDCYNGQAPFDQPAHLSIYSSDGTLVRSLDMTYRGMTKLPLVFTGACITPPGNVCVEESIYKETVILPPIPGGYDIVYQRCCRNHTILNITDPGGTGSSYHAHIPGSEITESNSSPRFTNFPPLFLCTNTPIIFDHSATDPDGDQLVYELCTPNTGADSICPIRGAAASPNCLPEAPPPPYSPVIYNNGYSGAVPFPGAPQLAISSSGALTGTPTETGQYVVGVCVSEYRDGVLLSINKRDFQFNILACANAISSIPTQTTFCNGYTVSFGNTSANSTKYYWDFGDPTTTTDNSTEKFPTYTYPDSGTYTVMLISSNSAINCVDTAYSVFKVQPKLDPYFATPDPQCLTGNAFNFQAGGIFTSDATFLWDFGNSASPQQSTSKNAAGIQFSESGLITVSLVISQYDCAKEFLAEVNVVPDPVAEITSQTQFCEGLTIDFKNSSKNSSNYLWEFGIPGNLDTSYAFEPSFIYPDSGVYIVTLFASNSYGCYSSDDSKFYVYPLLKAGMDTILPQCIRKNIFNFYASGVYSNQSVFSWDFGPDATPALSQLKNPIGVVFDSAGQHPVTITISENGCNKTFTDTVLIYPIPRASFKSQNDSGCYPITVQFYDSSISGTPLSYFWEFGDGTSSKEPNPLHTYNKSGVFDVGLTIIASSGCIDTIFFPQPELIKAFDYPEAKIEVTPDEASIFEPLFNFNDISLNSINCLLIFGDGDSTESCRIIHEYPDTGIYKYMQIVENTDGCLDTIMGKIRVLPEFRFEIPNAFSPNGDGKNDFFAPVIFGIIEMDIIIFDRWGEMIFKSNKTEASWNGEYKGRPCQQDVYNYVIRYKNVFLKEFTRRGHIVLIR